ncbi:MAG: 30S ribosomal protein S20 [Victivallaceae bacterium]
MASSKSALKRLRTSKAACLRNKARNSSLKTFEKKFRSAVEAADATQAADLQKLYFSKLDKAMKVGLIHANKVANKKSQVSKLMNSLQG